MSRTVNSLYDLVKPLRQSGSRSVASPTPHVTNITVARRQNALALFQAYAEKALAQGSPPKGLEQAFAARLQISPSMWSQIKSSRPIGDKLARQIESMTGQPVGWLDDARAPKQPSAAEAAFVELALAAYRSTHAAGRRALREQLQRMVLQASEPRSSGHRASQHTATASDTHTP